MQTFFETLFSDISIITGNIGKIGIGLVSCFFDIILLVQHFCLYGKNNDRQLESRIEEIEEKSPIVSRQRLESNLSITGSKYGFSPMASAVLYHTVKGDVMNSTASFRDVFSPDIMASQVRKFLIIFPRFSTRKCIEAFFKDLLLKDVGSEPPYSKIT